VAAKSLSRYRGLLPTAEKTSLEVRLMMQLSVGRGWRSYRQDFGQSAGLHLCAQLDRAYESQKSVGFNPMMQRAC
jgi:hypothetical protein